MKSDCPERPIVSERTSANQNCHSSRRPFSLTNAGVAGNLVIRNTARGNGTNYLMGTGNSYGPIATMAKLLLPKALLIRT